MESILNQQLLLWLIGFGILQGVVLATIVFFYPERDKNSNNILAIFIFTAAVLLLAPFIQLQIGWKYVWIFHSLKFVTISSLYLYIRSLSETISLKRQLKHYAFSLAYLPVAVHYVYFIKEKYDVTYVYTSTGETYDLILSFTNFLYLFFYFRLYFKAYFEHKQRVLENFSSIQKLGLNWIRQLIISFLVVVVFSYALFAVILSKPEYSTLACLMNMAFITLFLYFVTIKGKINPEIYKLRTLLAQQPVLEEKTKDEPARVQTQKITDSENNNLQWAAIAKRVREVVTADEFFKNENASMQELAEAVGEQPYLVSQAINNILGKTFFELINEYRVNHAKEMLANSENEKYSLIGIGFESGFNSKTTFNTTFKKYTGLTPSEYKRKFKNFKN